MDTVSFLRHIWPESGLYCLAEFFSSGAIKHHFYTDIEEAASAVAQIDSKTTVYHACASYKTNENRKHSNVNRLKAFFLDLDVGETKDYATQMDAAKAAAQVGSTLGFGKPTMISSGRGLHVYWTFEASVDVEVWKNAANMFRLCLDFMGVKHDSSRTTDQSSILRPVGSTWRKEGELPVKSLMVGSHRPFGYYVEKLSKYMGENGIQTNPTFQAPANVAGMFQMERLGTEQQYPASSAIQISNNCAQMARMRDLKGVVSEPEWRNAIGVIKHCVEGSDLAHEWSKGDPRYNYQDTEAKIIGWQTGPTTCEQFEKANPSQCAGCKFKGNIRSPIQLGYVAKTEAPIAMAKPVEVGMSDDEFKEFWPEGFHWNAVKRQMEYLGKDEHGADKWFPFCRSFFYPTTRIQLSDGTWGQRIRMEVNPGKYREFDLPTKTLASVDALCSALAAYEVVIYQKTGIKAVTYLSEFRHRMQVKERQMTLERRFGWVSREEPYQEFIIGNTAIAKTGESRVSLDADIKYNRHLYEGELARGSEAEWVRIVNEVYNRPGAEVYQFCIMALISSPLVGLIGQTQWHGIPIGLTGASGQGKTTVGLVAASAYGPSAMFKFDAANATNNAPDPFFGLMHNLPIILDEYTGKDPAVVVNQLYGMSTGQGRMRMNQKGGLSEMIYNWNLIPLVTGNTNINETMDRMAPTVSEAGMVRVFEYAFRGDEVQTIFKGEDVQDLVERQLSENYGVVGRMFLRYAMKHADKIRADFYVLRNKLNAEAEGQQSKERFFIDLIITTYLGGRILSELGLIKWDVKNVIDWAMEHKNTLRSARITTSTSIEDKVAQFVGSLVGHTIITKTYGGMVEPLVDRLYGEPLARLCTGERKFFVAHRWLMQWCKDTGVSPSLMKDEMQKHGYIVGDTKMYLSKGVPSMPSPQQRCLELAYDMVSEPVNTTVAKNLTVDG